VNDSSKTAILTTQMTNGEVDVAEAAWEVEEDVEKVDEA